MGMSKFRLVTIGGGNGHSELLRGLADYADQLEITAIVTTMDDGGSTGKLRKEYDVPAPGDARRCVLALSPHQKSISFWEHRFGSGELSGHTVGNLVLVALTKKYGSLQEALARMESVFDAVGKVLPVTNASTQLVAMLANGDVLRGESAIDEPEGDMPLNIETLSLDPSAEAADGVCDSIRQADAVVFSMGDLYTSILPNVLVSGVAEALQETSATLAHVCNRSNTPTDTAGFTTADYARVLTEYIGRSLDTMLVDDGTVACDDGADLVQKEDVTGVQVYESDLADESDAEYISGTKAAAAIMKHVCELS